MSEENIIPQKVDPFRFADNAVRLKGLLHVNNMHRLCESLQDDTGEIEVKVEFGKNEQGASYISGLFSGALQLQCQRCMESYRSEIAGKIWLAIVHSEEEAKKLPEDYDSIVINDDILSIQDVIEDELIVSLPVVPMHHPKDCKVTLPLNIESEQVALLEKESPFKVIEFLKTKRDPK